MVVCGSSEWLRFVVVVSGCGSSECLWFVVVVSGCGLRGFLICGGGLWWL